MVDEDFLAHELALPEGHGKDHVVQWHVFRSREAAEAFMPHVKLAEGQQLVGGYTRDSVGPLWWVGVQVDDLDRWGNRTAVNKHGASA
ncbi:hypothetical protein [Thioalkalivibrio sulfidiphilus]|uniref:hypothetical protein n=1 Tax=Thioalkalivibrio sulfidiphilus TaxID=1033854 RepID=UPI00037D4092|nr:hypothetical protein [Thioalkalivibrio sulfidiphilus]